MRAEIEHKELCGWVANNKPLFEGNQTLQDGLERLLNHWGKWVKSGNKIGLGYSGKNNLAKISESGGMFFYGTGLKLIPDDPRAEEMERLIIKLSHFNPREANAVKEYYGKQLSRQEAASRLKISVTTLNERIRLAKMWLSGRLTVYFDV